MPVRILIADDHSLVRSTLKAFLEGHAEWEVCGEAADGLEALQKAVELKPDVIILDVGMPKMDGLQTAREIFSVFPDVPILIYTNYVFPPAAELEAKKLGVRQVVTKGSSADHLISALESLLGEGPRVQGYTTASRTNLPKIDPQGDPPQT